MLLSSRKDSHDYQLMPEVDLDPNQDLLIEKEVYSSFNGGRFHQLPHAACSSFMHVASHHRWLSSYAWHLRVWVQPVRASPQASLAWRRSYVRKGMTG